MDGTFEFRVCLADDPSGAAPLLYHICVQPQVSAGRGGPPCGGADTTLTLNVEDLRAVLSGQLSPFQAYMSGRVTVSGDTAAAMRLRSLGDVATNCI